MSIKMEKNERETWIGKSKMCLCEDNVVSIVIIGEVDDKTALGFRETGLELAGMLEGNWKVLIDLNKAGKMSPAARKIVQELSRHEKVWKVAAFGLNPVARIVAAFGMGADSKEKHFRFFKTKEEALEWLKKD